MAVPPENHLIAVAGLVVVGGTKTLLALPDP
jgi:hypothetical protein